MAGVAMTIAPIAAATSSRPRMPIAFTPIDDPLGQFRQFDGTFREHRHKTAIYGVAPINFLLFSPEDDFILSRVVDFQVEKARKPFGDLLGVIDAEPA